MTAIERLRSTRRLLIAALLLRAILIALGVTLAVLVAIAAADLFAGLPLGVRSALRFAALAGGIGAGVLALRDMRHGTSDARVALWIEEHVPELRYALVTLAAPASAPPAHAAMLEARIHTVQWEPATRRTLGRGVTLPLAGALAGAALLLATPTATRARVTTPRVGDAVTRPGLAVPVDAVETISVRVTPPAYTGERAQVVEQPSLVTAIVGSRIELRGRGAARRVVVSVDGARHTVRQDGAAWRVSLVAGSRPVTIGLRDTVARRDRVVAVEPRADGVPRVTLEQPARDTVLRVATGAIPLRATGLDDFGVASLRFEWIVSAGEGENFTFRSGAVGFAGNNARSRTITGALSLDSLQLSPGSIVHVRAVAYDGNAVGGAGEGVSETRMLRVARAGEYDSLAVEAAAPAEADKSALSQRMLIMQTEALEKRRPRLDRRTLVAEATAIALDQSRLRKRVGELVFQRLTGEDSGEHSHDDLTPEELMAHAAAESGVAPGGHGDEAPIVAINAPLLEAYNAMWEAQTSLALAELREALPAMYRALAAIQRARAAERIYLRGRTPEVVIDLGRVRLAGERPASTGPRSARIASPGERVVEARFERALAIAARAPRAAADSLMLLRLTLVGDGPDARPELAAALADAAARLRGTDAAAAESALRTARRVVAGEPRHAAGFPSWGGP